MPLSYYIILFLTGIFIGFINTLAGGGSTILYPILIFMGMPIHTAIGTSRIAFISQGLFSAAGFKSKGVFIFPFNLYVALSAMLGGIIGAWISLHTAAQHLTRFLVFMMIIIAILMIWQARIHKKTKQIKIQGKYLYISFLTYFLIGIYGGFLHAGIGFMIILAATLVNQMNLTQSNSIKALIILTVTIPALYMFAIKDQVNWNAGFVIAAGTAIGSWLTSRWSVHINEKYIRFLMVTIIIGLAIKLWLTH